MEEKIMMMVIMVLSEFYTRTRFNGFGHMNEYYTQAMPAIIIIQLVLPRFMPCLDIVVSYSLLLHVDRRDVDGRYGYHLIISLTSLPTSRDKIVGACREVMSLCSLSSNTAQRRNYDDDGGGGADETVIFLFVAPPQTNTKSGVILVLS
ncbi:hypothetical protein Ocin01_03924 [Orchesella cincta]|uniref:Uncharacterized protein n=1 Tax=Orchesella cincta TaxID=48709 RepID=A0A1D2NBY0_ORCCI|nr:hypothetical protein Ocin01_03924 [Orchesella cincta]